MTYTVSIPEFGHANQLHTCLHALRRNSMHSPQILVLWTNPSQLPPTWSKHEGVNWDEGPLSNVQELIYSHEAWFEKHENQGDRRHRTLS